MNTHEPASPLQANRASPLPLGTKTVYGRIRAVASFAGERYYFMVDHGVVSMAPATMVENEIRPVAP